MYNYCYELDWVKYDNDLEYFEVIKFLMENDPTIFCNEFDIINLFKGELRVEKWYGDIEVIRELSLKYSDVTFIFKKEDLNNIMGSSNFYLKNGKIQECKVKRVIFESYDPSFFHN